VIDMRISLMIAPAVCLTLAAPPAARAQSLASRVNRAEDVDLRFSFSIRPDICGRGQSIYYGRNNRTNWGNDRYSRDLEYDVDCDNGPGRVVIAKRDGEIADLRFYVGGRWRESSSAVNLGTVSARDAADYLIGLAESHEGKIGEKAIFPVTLIDSVVVWPSLLRIARNERRPRSTRTQAVFWLGQIAGEAVTRGLNDLVAEDDVDREVRKQAVFALSQQRNREGIPSLIRVVRTSRDPEIRKTALFWLAQSNDPRALDLIEELLTRK
jgi:hypothetical protein